MYALIVKCRKLGLPIDLQLALFDRMIVPIMLYGSEVWGPENYIETEKLHLKFVKHILGVHGWYMENWVDFLWKFKLKKGWLVIWKEINYRKGIETMQRYIWSIAIFI